MKILNIDEFNESKIIVPEFESWDNAHAKAWWDSFSSTHKTFDDKVKALRGKVSNPEGLIAKIEKQVTGKWPSEK